MKVKELIELLEKFNKESVVISGEAVFRNIADVVALDPGYVEILMGTRA